MTESEIDWSSIAALLRSCLRHHLYGVSTADLEDVVQEASVRLLRAVRREPPRILEALARDIARKTAIDHHRRTECWRRLLEELRSTPEGDLPASEQTTDLLGDPGARLRFVVLNFFHDRSPGCNRLAASWFRNEQSWVTVAAESGRTPEAVRQQWSRCIRLLRQEMQRDSGFLSEWTRGQE